MSWRDAFDQAQHGELHEMISTLRHWNQTVVKSSGIGYHLNQMEKVMSAIDLLNNFGEEHLGIIGDLLTKCEELENLEIHEEKLIRAMNEFSENELKGIRK